MKHHRAFLQSVVSAIPGSGCARMNGTFTYFINLDTVRNPGNVRGFMIFLDGIAGFHLLCLNIKAYPILSSIYDYVT